MPSQLSPGLTHKMTLIKAGLYGMAAGALLDVYTQTFPLWLGVGWLTAGLGCYLYLRLRYAQKA